MLYLRSMSAWSSPLAGVVVGAVIASLTAVATQLHADWREERRATRKTLEAAHAEWQRLQIETTLSLQDCLNSLSILYNGSVIYSGEPSGARIDRPEGFANERGRAVMLCSWLDDAQLSRRIRLLLTGLDTPFVMGVPEQEDIGKTTAACRDMQDVLGQRVQGLHRLIVATKIPSNPS